MFRYCSTTSTVTPTPGQRASVSDASRRTSCSFASSPLGPSTSKSRRMTLSVEVSTSIAPAYGCTKPTRPSVVSGRMSAGSRVRKSPSAYAALTIRPFAVPGCVLTPRNVIVASRALHVSWLISPSVSPSTV